MALERTPASPERTPAEILEDHGTESVNRVIKIERWVQRVTRLTLALVATTMLTGLLVTIGFVYLLHQIQNSRFETAVKGCQINRTSTHDSLEELMTSLSNTDAQRARSKALADRYFPADRQSCVQYAHDLGLRKS
jgi:hypothetical protein